MEKKQTNILRELRQKKGLTQEEIADRLCITRTAYNKKENSKNGIRIEDLKRLIGVLDLSEKDVLSILNYDSSNPKNEVIQCYEKVIMTYKGLLSFIFNMLYSEYEFFHEVSYLPFNEINDDEIERVSSELGIEVTELTEEIYNTKMIQESDEYLDPERYGLFCDFLYDHPLAIKILEFGLLGDEHQYYFERWQKDFKLSDDQSHNPIHNVVISVNKNYELQKEMKNFNSIIHSEKFTIDYSTYLNSFDRL